VHRAGAELLDDGDVVDLGDRAFEVAHTPNHGPGRIALWEKAAQTLYSGDIVYDGLLIEDNHNSNAEDYAASMGRLLTLPVETVHGGHFDSFSGARLRCIVTEWLSSKTHA